MKDLSKAGSHKTVCFTVVTAKADDHPASPASVNTEYEIAVFRQFSSCWHKRCSLTHHYRDNRGRAVLMNNAALVSPVFGRHPERNGERGDEFVWRR